ncbi:hypothetical protein NLX67_22050 [Domibacillus sp. A3M-37]|uniref:hypothetical protein n=1 Tax=Domibacillus sp. A3M-37 TaxID=2962037 RepID=UPI0020B87C64|nr:hypothetical protein [Domibacillus sp. A3M-37]MCP3764997.1 hypothetical protein [Domibacillus sp. A3M-37]
MRTRTRAKYRSKDSEDHFMEVFMAGMEDRSMAVTDHFTADMDRFTVDMVATDHFTVDMDRFTVDMDRFTADMVG